MPSPRASQVSIGGAPAGFDRAAPTGSHQSHRTRTVRGRLEGSVPRPTGLAPPEPADRVDEGTLVRPLVSQAAGLSRLWAESQPGLGKVLVMRVLVAGGTGVVGRRLVPQLVARGHHVTATAT